MNKDTEQVILRTDTIRQYLADSGYSQSEFARKIDVNRHHLNLMLNYKHYNNESKTRVTHGRAEADRYWTNLRTKITEAILNGRA